MDGRPIGVFDSGLGGLTVARALMDLAPAEGIVYLGDTARYPYGPRSQNEVKLFAAEIARWLVAERGVKMVVVACNTATAASLEHLQEKLAVPVVGVIDPGLRAAARVSRTKRVGIIATAGTIGSGAYAKAARGIEVHCLACPGFVELVEEGRTSGPEAQELVERRLRPLLAAKVDTLLLGCTHYPLLARTISEVMGQEVTLVSSAEETAFEVRAVLSRSALERPPGPPGERVWCSSGDPGLFAHLAQRLLSLDLGTVELVRWAAQDRLAPHALRSQAWG
jgi:glutamate racemase